MRRSAAVSATSGMSNVGDNTAKNHTATNPAAERRQNSTKAPKTSSAVANNQGQAWAIVFK